MAKKKVKTKNYLRGDVKKAKARRAKLIKYAKENPAEAAALGLMAVPVVGWAASGAVRTVAGAAKLYKKRKLIKGVAKKAYEKVKTKVGPTVKKAGEKLTKAFGPKHKKAGKVYSTKRGAEMGRAGSTKHKVVRQKDKVTTFRKKKTVPASTNIFSSSATYKKQYGIEPTARSAITSKKALFTAGAIGYVGSQSGKTSKPKKKTNGGGAKPPKGYNPGSVPSQQGKGIGSYKDRDSASPNAIAQPRKKGPVKRKPQGERKYKPGTSGGDRPATRSSGIPSFIEMVHKQRRIRGKGGPMGGRKGGY